MDDLLESKVDLILTAPPYNVRNKRSMDNSLYDIIKPEDMSDFVELVRNIMAAGEHGPVFCLCMQVSTWYKKLEYTEEEVPNF